MKLNFRQGIVEYQIPTFLGVHYPTVDLIVTDTPTIVTFSTGTSDYLLIEPTTITSAWGPLYLQQDQWLYWDIDMRTGVRTFGITTLQPIVSAIAPVQPSGDQHWFNTTTNQMMVYYNGSWQQRVRVFACKLAAGAVPIGVGEQGFTGTQAGLDVESYSGPIVYSNDDGLPITTADGTFLTTEDNLRTATVNVASVKLASLVLPAMAEQNIAAYTVVKFTDFGKIVHGDSFTGSQPKQYGIIQSDVITGEITNVTMSGVISSSTWDWTSAGVNSYLYPDEAGALTPTPTVPDQTPIATIVDKQTIVLGSPVVTINNPPVNLATATSYGIGRLSVPADNPSDPIMVGTNDPRLISQPISFIIGLQPALDSKLALAGGTMTGNLILNEDPVLPLQAATKEYVDSHTPTIAEPLNQIVVGTGAGITSTPLSTINPVTGGVLINYNTATEQSAPVAGGADVIIAAPSTIGTEVQASGNNITIIGGNANNATGNGGNITLSAGSVQGSTPYSPVHGGNVVLKVGSGNPNPAVWTIGHYNSNTLTISGAYQGFNTIPMKFVTSTATDGVTAVVLGLASFSTVNSGAFTAGYSFSTSGANWSTYPCPTPITSVNTVIGHLGTTWTMTDGTTFVTSQDLVTWTPQQFPLPAPGANNIWIPLEVASSTTTQYIVLSTQSTVSNTLNGTITISYSNDGKTWTATPVIPVATGPTCATAIAASPTGACVPIIPQYISGQSGSLLTIVITGTTATVQTVVGIPQSVIDSASACLFTNPTTGPLGIVYFNGVYIIELPQLNPPYTVFYQSTDGINWSFLSSLPNSDTAGALYISNNMLTVVSAQSMSTGVPGVTTNTVYSNLVVQTSINGTTWNVTPGSATLTSQPVYFIPATSLWHGSLPTLVGSYGVLDFSVMNYYLALQTHPSAVADTGVSYGSVQVMRDDNQVFAIDSDGKHIYRETGSGSWGLSSTVSDSGSPEWLSSATRMPTYTFVYEGVPNDYQLVAMSSQGIYIVSEYSMDGTTTSATFPANLIVPDTLLLYAGANSAGNAALPAGLSPVSASPAGVVGYRVITSEDVATYGQPGGWVLTTDDAAAVIVFGKAGSQPSIGGQLIAPPILDSTITSITTTPVTINALGVMAVSIFLGADGFHDYISTANPYQISYTSNGINQNGGVVLAVSILNNYINQMSPTATISVASNPPGLFSQYQTVTLIIQ